MKISRSSVLLHAGAINAAGTGAVEQNQPANQIDWGWADEVTFIVDVQSVQGVPTDWSLTGKFQFCMPDTTGAGYSAERWFDLQAEQVSKCIVEGVGWYGGASAAPVGAAVGTIAKLGDTLPLTVQRTIRNFGLRTRILLVPTFTGGTTPTVTCSVMAVAKG